MSIFGRRKRRRQRFSERPSLPAADIFEQHYRDSALEFSDFANVWSLVAFHLGVDAERLRPADRFDDQLRPEEGTELIDELEDLTVFVRSEAERRGKTFNVRELNTLDDLVKLLVDRKRER